MEAHGETVEEIRLVDGIYYSSERGKHEGYAFIVWQNAIGLLGLEIISGQPGKLELRISARE